jgi:hypothetical protein
MTLTPRRSANLARRLVDALSFDEIEPPKADELEREYTARCLAPVVRSVLEALPGAGLRLRGDGSHEQAIPARVLDVEFYPDLAVSLGQQHLWAAEVKFVRSSGRQNSVATAIGQAVLYRSRYEHTAVVLIDVGRHNAGALRAFTDIEEALGLQFIVRSKVGRGLLTNRVKRPSEP